MLLGVGRSFIIQLKTWRPFTALSGYFPYFRVTLDFLKTAVPGKQKTVIWVGPPLKIIVVLRGGVRGPKSLRQSPGARARGAAGFRFRDL
jgi:hypothetical protein